MSRTPLTRSGNVSSKRNGRYQRTAWIAKSSWPYLQIPFLTSSRYAINSPSLLRALSCAFGGPFYVAGIWKAASDILAFAQPVLLRELLRFFMSYKTDDPQPLYRGYSIAIWMFVCSVAQTIFLNQYYHLCFRCGMHVRTSLITAIYKKSLLLSSPVRQNFTVSTSTLVESNHQRVRIRKH